MCCSRQCTISTDKFFLSSLYFVFSFVKCFGFFLFVFYIFYWICIGCFSHIEHSYVKTKLVHKLYRVQAIGSLRIENFKNLLTPDQYKKCITKIIATWYSLTRNLFLDYLYNVSFISLFTLFIFFIIFLVLIAFLCLTNSVICSKWYCWWKRLGPKKKFWGHSRAWEVCRMIY